MPTQRTVELLKKSAISTVVAQEIENQLAQFSYVVVGEFGSEFTINTRNEVAYDQASKKTWKWLGDLPHTVLATDTPNATDWEDVTNASLAGQLEDPTQSALRVARMTVACKSIKDLATAPIVEDTVYLVSGCYEDEDPCLYVLKWDPLKDKADHDGANVIDPDRIDAWDGTQPNISTYLTSGTGTGCFISVLCENYPPQNFGAIAKASVDSTESMIAWAKQGGRLPLPKGVYKVTKMVNMGTNSHIVGESTGKGTGGGSGGVTTEADLGASIIYVDSSFDTLSGSYAVNMEQSGAQFTGGAENVTIWNERSGGAQCGLLRVKAPYDQLYLRNLNLIFAGGGNEALLVDGVTDFGNSLGQTVLLENIVAIGDDDSTSSTKAVVRLKHINEFQMVGVKSFGCAIFLDPLRVGNPIELQGCRGGTLIGCSSAASQGDGIRVFSSASRSTFGINIHGHTYEQCQTSSLHVDGDNNPSLPAAYIQEYAPRFESPQNRGPKFTRALNCRSETTFWNSTIDANCDNCVIYATNYDAVTNAGGSSNAVIALPSTYSGSWQIGNDIAVKKDGANPTLYLYSGDVNGLRIRSLTSDVNNFGFELADRSDKANKKVTYNNGEFGVYGTLPTKYIFNNEQMEEQKVSLFENAINIDAGSGLGQGIGAGIMSVPISANHAITTYHTNKELVYDGASITATIPTDAAAAIPVNSKVSLLNIGSTVTYTASAGVTVNGVDGGSFTIDQWQNGILAKIGPNAWAAIGGISNVS